MNFILAGYIYSLLQVTKILGLVNKKLSIFLVSFLIAFFSYLLILPDYFSYKEIYEASPALGDIILSPFSSFVLMGVEPGYVILNSMAKSFGLGYDFFRFTIILFVIFTKLYVLSRISNNFIISSTAYLALFIFMDLFILRQSIASAIIALSVLYLYKQASSKALFFLLLAPMFHVIALIAAPIIFIYKYKFKTIFYISVIIFAMFVGYFGIGSIVSQLIIGVSGDESFVADKLARYLASERAEATGIFRVSTLLILTLMVFVILFMPRKLLDDKFFLILNLSLYAFLVLVLFNDFGILGDRGYRVIGFPLLAFFGYVTSLFAKKDRFFVTALVSLVFVVLATFFINPDYISWKF